jgi:hypothetical protein
MSGSLDKNSQVKIWVIFSLFVFSIIGLIGYEITIYSKAKQQRENFETLRIMESQLIQSGSKTDTNSTRDSTYIK